MDSRGELHRVLATLSASGARYLVVGGVAVVLHGHPRFTADLDLVIELRPENVRRALAALGTLGYRPRAPVAAADFADAKTRRGWIEDKGLTVFSLWSAALPTTEVDIFVEEPFEFADAYDRAVRVSLGDTIVTIASIADLIDLKTSAGRVKDLEDVRQLRAIAEETEREPNPER